MRGRRRPGAPDPASLVGVGAEEEARLEESVRRRKAGHG